MQRIEDRFIVAGVYAVALFMDLLDTTIVNVALPTFARDFRASTTAIEWIVTGYLLSLAVFIPVSGWAGDRFGTKRTLLFALGVFTAGSLLCSLAWSLESLVAFRILQGIGGGMLTPVGAAMLYRAFPPEERARVSSIITVPAVLAPASGPVLGGYLLQVTGWRALFWVNVPIGLGLLAVSALWLREQRQTNPGRFDPLGFGLAALGLAALLNGLALAGDRGLTDPRAVTFVLGGSIILAAFAVVELRTAQPMLDLRLFREPLFARGIMVQLFAFGGQFGTLFLLPLLLQSERGLSPLQSGLATFPQAVGIMLVTPVAGRIYRQVGPRRMAAVGLGVAGLATLAFVHVDLQTNLWWIRALMLARGGGFALSLIAMQTATFATIPRPSMGRGTAIYSVTRQVGVSLAVAVLATVLSSQLLARGVALGDPAGQAGAVAAFHLSFVAAALLAFLAALGALRVDDRLAASTLQPPPKPAVAERLAAEPTPTVARIAASARNGASPRHSAAD
jgi:EmrB/QacA subfamily drug resistance transporter